MKKYHSLILILVLIMLTGCATPKDIKFTPMTPVKTDGVITAMDLFLKADPETKKKRPPNAMDIVILGDEKVMVALSLYEFKEIFWLSIYVYNNLDVPFVINASDFILMDASRTIFSRVQPHDAANLYLSKLSEQPPYLYEPKYNISLQSNTTGYVSSSGYVSANTTTTGTVYEDPYYKLGYDLGYSIGLAVVENYNKKIMNMAGAVYSSGLVDGTSVPPKSGLQGAVYWLKRSAPVKPIILRISSINYEIQFKPKVSPR
jgi:hypothetical protein